MGLARRTCPAECANLKGCTESSNPAPSSCSPAQKPLTSLMSYDLRSFSTPPANRPNGRARSRAASKSPRPQDFPQFGLTANPPRPPAPSLRRRPVIGLVKSGEILPESQNDFPSGTVPLLGDNNLRLALQVGIILLVNFLTENEHHHVGVLLD